jgi:hypothetical protein
MAMKNPFGILKKKASCAELEAALIDAHASASDAATKFERAKSEYASGILCDSLDDALKAKEALNIAEVERERARAFVSALEGQIAAARVVEAEVALDAKRKSVETEASAVEAALRKEYPKLANALVELLKRLTAAERAVDAINLELQECGRSDLVDAIETRVYPVPEIIWQETVSIRNRTSLREIEGVASGWN